MGKATLVFLRCFGLQLSSVTTSMCCSKTHLEGSRLVVGGLSKPEVKMDAKSLPFSEPVKARNIESGIHGSRAKQRKEL